MDARMREIDYNKDFPYFFSDLSKDSGCSIKVSKSSVKKFTYSLYFYSACQLFIATRTMDTNPKYLFSLLGLTKVAKWKLIPLGAFESFMSVSIASILLFNVTFFLAYVKSTQFSLDSLR